MLKAFPFLGLFLGVTALFGGAGQSSQNTAASTVSPDIPTVAFCELIHNSQPYDGKVVRVRGIYSSGFEKVVISAPDCPAASTWLAVPPSYAACTKRKMQKKFEKTDWGPGLDIVIVGRFESKGNYGHLGMYPYRIVVTCVENIQSLGHFRNLPDEKK